MARFTYATAKATLGKRDSKKVENNTYLETNSDGSIGIRFHSTTVVVLFEDGTIEVDNGGYTSVTTKQRLGKFTSFTFETRKGSWFVHTNSGLYEFERHMRFDANHEPLGQYRKISNESFLNARQETA